MNAQIRIKLLLLMLVLALLAIVPTAALAQPNCVELNDVSTFDYRSYGIGVHRTCGDIDPICGALRLKQIALGAPIEAWVKASREAAISAGVSPIPTNIRSQVEHLFPASLLDKVRIKAGGGFLGTLQWFREKMGGGAITLDNVIVFFDDRNAICNFSDNKEQTKCFKRWVHELEHVRQYEQLGVDGFAQAYADQTCILPGDSPAVGYYSGNCQLERRAERKGDLWDQTDLASFCTFFWRYVDAAYTGANGTPDGTSQRPYPDLTTGVNATAVGSILWVQPGTYTVNGNFLNKRMIIRAPRGGVDIRARSTAVADTLASLSAASYGGELSSDSIAAAFGENLGAGVAVATSLPLPTTLGGVTVKVKDSAGVERNAPLFFVSPGQINYLIPGGTASGIASIGVQKGNAIVASQTIPINAVAPGLFAANANGQGAAAAVALRVRANGTLSYEPVVRFDSQAGRFVSLPIDLGPEGEQVFLILYGTGFRGRSKLEAIRAYIGGEPAEVLFAGGLQEFAGLDQANIRLPRNLAGKGDVGILFTVDNRSANEVRINVR